MVLCQSAVTNDNAWKNVGDWTCKFMTVHATWILVKIYDAVKLRWDYKCKPQDKHKYAQFLIHVPPLCKYFCNATRVAVDFI